MERLPGSSSVRLTPQRISNRRVVRAIVAVALVIAIAGFMISTLYRFASWRNAYIAALPEQRAELVSISVPANVGMSSLNHVFTMVWNGQEVNAKLSAKVIQEGMTDTSGTQAVIVAKRDADPGYVLFKAVNQTVVFPSFPILKLKPGFYDLRAYTAKPPAK